jgi:undecaprenyl diphosphate synthase
MHIAFILDGNRRWAKARGLPKRIGHHRGVQNFKTLLPACIEQGVTHVTAYALSTENLKERDGAELRGLFAEIKLFGSDLATFHQHQIRIQVLGRLSAFPTDVQQVLKKAIRETAKYTKLHANLALAYGGRDELVRAAKHLAKSGKPCTEKNFESFLDSAGQPDPDLLVRTGGKKRLSNFLPWQLAYTELYFTDVMWPDFDAKELKKSIAWYEAQGRNFGK